MNCFPLLPEVIENASLEELRKFLRVAFDAKRPLVSPSGSPFKGFIWGEYGMISSGKHTKSHRFNGIYMGFNGMIPSGYVKIAIEDGDL